MNYKLYKTPENKQFAMMLNENGYMISFSFDPANTDYQAFKKDINEGAELLDADGKTMTAEQAKQFVKELP